MGGSEIQNSEIHRYRHLKLQKIKLNPKNKK